MARPLGGKIILDLKALRKGRGLFSNAISSRIGPALRSAFDLETDINDIEARAKVASKLAKLAEGLPADLRISVLAAFGLIPEARHPLYQDRVNWAARKLGRLPRTTRRRIDDGLHQLAQAIAAEQTSPDATALDPNQLWRADTTRVAANLDASISELLEMHSIVSNIDQLSEVQVTLPTSDIVDSTIFYGGTLIDSSADPRAVTVRFSSPINRGEKHDFLVRHTLQNIKRPTAYITYRAETSRNELDLRVRFNKVDLPWRITLLDGTQSNQVTNLIPHGQPCSVGAAGELHIVFHELVSRHRLRCPMGLVTEPAPTPLALDNLQELTTSPGSSTAGGQVVTTARHRPGATSWDADWARAADLLDVDRAPVSATKTRNIPPVV